ncbi:MAG: hypothetical protein ACI9EW_004016 [Cellvibrionaceae bacterium]|jgi:hypothetical protein
MLSSGDQEPAILLFDDKGGLMIQQRLKIYIPIIVLLFAIGLPTRITPNTYPFWYTTYAGDFIWAMMIFFLYRLFFRWQPIQAFLVALSTTYIIEITQLFNPLWLENLRSIKLIGLIIGYSFLWSDIVAYTAGISLGAIIDIAVVSRIKNTD